jgi:hypothetical protein
MKQSVITATTISTLVAKAEDVIDRPLTYMENALIEYVVDQIRLGLVEK